MLKAEGGGPGIKEGWTGEGSLWNTHSVKKGRAKKGELTPMGKKGGKKKVTGNFVCAGPTQNWKSGITSKKPRPKGRARAGRGSGYFETRPLRSKHIFPTFGTINKHPCRRENWGRISFSREGEKTKRGKTSRKTLWAGTQRKRARCPEKNGRST